MFYSYSLSRWQARVCRIAAALFIVVALAQAAALLFSIVAPNTTMRSHCDAAGCATTSLRDPAFPEQVQTRIASIPGGAARLMAELDRPALRLGLAAVDLIDQLPLILLLACVAVAMWRLSARGDDDLSRAIPWLGWASMAALFDALGSPLAQSGRTSMLLSAIGPDRMFYIELELRALLMNLLLAFAAFVVTWALASGNRARRDIAAIV